MAYKVFTGGLMQLAIYSTQLLITNSKCHIYQKGTTQENLDKLIQNVQIENDSNMINNWKYLGVPVLTTVRNTTVFFLKTLLLYLFSKFSYSTLVSVSHPCNFFSSHLIFQIPLSAVIIIRTIYEN